MLAEWIDITVPLREGMVVWPGDPPFRILRASDMARGDEMNVSEFSSTVHAGTHVDAPLHCFRDGAGVEALPMDAMIGPARVIGITDPVAVSAAELARYDLQPGERVLFRTRNSERDWSMEPFHHDFVYVSVEAARHLAGRRVRAVGIDYLSVGGLDAGLFETHQRLLEAGIYVIEGLDLRAVEPGDYDLVCLPLKLAGSDGAPARAAVRRRS